MGHVGLWDTRQAHPSAHTSARTSVRTSAIALMTALVLPFGLVGCTIDKQDQSGEPNVASTLEQNSSQVNEETLMAPNSTMASEARQAQPNANGAQNPAGPNASNLAGKVIYLDPGHAGTPPPADLMVTDGRGGLKPCNTAGTASNDGYSEHEFNWLMAQEIKQLLEQRGAQVLLSRADDTGRADCIDVRAEKENASNADAVVSLHADGAGEGNRGFHISAIAQPLANNDEQGSTALATALRDAFVAAGFAPSNYLGSQGLNPRADLTGLNLSTKPKALVEYGNMRDSSDIALLTSSEGRQRLAEATVAGLEGFLAQ